MVAILVALWLYKHGGTVVFGHLCKGQFSIKSVFPRHPPFGTMPTYLAAAHLKWSKDVVIPLVVGMVENEVLPWLIINVFEVLVLNIMLYRPSQ